MAGNVTPSEMQDLKIFSKITGILSSRGDFVSCILRSNMEQKRAVELLKGLIGGGKKFNPSDDELRERWQLDSALP
jgi:hypothetical protein